MSQQINFSDLSDVQKESYLKFIIDNDIPLQQDEQSPQDYLVANISLPTAIKKINSSYDSSTKPRNILESSLEIEKRTIKHDSSDIKNKENEKMQHQPSSQHQRRDSKSPSIVLRDSTHKNNIVRKNTPVMKKANHSRANSMQDCKLERLQSTVNKDQYEGVQVFQQKNKVPESTFTFQGGKLLNARNQNKKDLTGKENKLNESSKGQQLTNPLTTSAKATRSNNPKITLPSFEYQQNQRTSKDNILIIETESHTESTNSTEGKEHSSNKPSMKEIYSILRSVGFSPKLLLSECGEEDNQSSISGEMRSDPSDLPSKRGDNCQTININLNNNVQNLQTKLVSLKNDPHVNRQIARSFTPKKAEGTKEKDKPRSNNYLSSFPRNSKNPNECQSLSDNKAKERNASHFPSNGKSFTQTTLSQVCSPSKTNKGVYPMKKSKKEVAEQNKSSIMLKTTNQQDEKDEQLNQEKITENLDNKPLARKLSYEKTPKKTAQGQVTQGCDELGQSLWRTVPQNKWPIMSAKESNQQYHKCSSKSGAKAEILFPSTTFQNFPNIRRLFKHKAERISRTPIIQASSLMEKIYNFRVGNVRFKGFFREFVYDFFLSKIASSANNAEGSLANFLACLEFHSETSPASRQFLEIMENDDDEQLQFLISAMKELQTHFKETNVLSVRITEKQLPMLFELILGEIARPFEDKQRFLEKERETFNIFEFSLRDQHIFFYQKIRFLEGIFSTEEFKTQQTVSVLEFLAVFGLFRSTPEFIALNASYKNHESRRQSGQLFQMINESFGLVQECLSSRRETTQWHKLQEVVQRQGTINPDSYFSDSKPSIKQNTTFNSATASTAGRSRQMSTLSSLSAVKKLFDENDEEQLKSQSFLSILFSEMDQMVHEFITMFEIKSYSSISKLHGLISKKCRLLIAALSSCDQSKWFDLLTITNPNYQQKMQAETTQKLFEAYQKSYCSEDRKDLTNIRQFCRIILKVPELSEAISKLLICVLVPEE